jgi:hypothetical protein
MFNYISGAAQYSEDFWTRMATHNDLLAEEKGGDLTNATMFLDEEVICDDKNTYSPEVEQSILDIVANGWRNGELAVGPTKGRI